MKPLGSNKPHLVIMVGIPGSGKSFFAEHFSDTFKAPIVSFDKIQKELAKNDQLPEHAEEIAASIADYMLSEVLKTEQTVIYDGPSDLRLQRDIISRKARIHGYDTLLVWVQTEQSSSMKRATKRPTGEISITSEEFESRVKHFNNPGRYENTVVISGKHTYPSQLKIVLKNLVTPVEKIEKINIPDKPLKPENRRILIR